MSTESQPSVSFEPQHFYRDDFKGGEPKLTRLFRRGEPYARAAMAGRVASTSVLFDDYHNALNPKKYRPAEVYGQLQRAAEAAGVPLDYIGREAACADLAEGVLKQLCEHPSSAPYIQAANNGTVWLLDTPPSRQHGTAPAMRPQVRDHSRRPIDDVSIELYGVDHTAPEDPFACCFLSAIWQGLRFGAIRSPGFDAPPLIEDHNFPDWNWGEIPPLVQLNPDAAPFVAERTFSVLSGENIIVENAANRIVKHLGTVLDVPQFASDNIGYAMI